MKGTWVTTEIQDEKLRYSYEPHKPIKLTGTPWLYCQHCGLQYLNTKITKWSIKMGCNHSYHRDYERMF